MDNIQILHEDNHLIAVNKPAGWLVQGDITGEMTLADWVKEYIKVRYNKPGDVFLGIAHRLDRPASGAVVFARTSKALIRMNKLFADREIKKTYLCIVKKRPNPIKGTLTDYIWKDKSRNVSKALDKPSRKYPDAKKSVLDYKLLAEIDNHYLLEINLKTGRPHQIRVQLSKLGCPILGDLKYNSNFKTNKGNIFLHSKSLEFLHPVKKESIKIESFIPSDPIWKMFDDFYEI